MLCWGFVVIRSGLAIFVAVVVVVVFLLYVHNTAMVTPGRSNHNISV